MPIGWVLDPVSAWFTDDDGVEDSTKSMPRWRANVTQARVTITAWKDAIASGRLEWKTTRGVQCDTTFQARLEDHDGVLARAAAPVPAPATK